MKIFNVIATGAVILGCMSPVCYGQTTQDEINIVQGLYGKEKREMVAQVMDLDEGEAATFWPLYDNYETERKKLGADRIAIIEDYANNYDQLTDTKADELVNRVFKNDAALAKLHKSYYDKVKKAMSPRIAAKFIQVESYLQSAIRFTIADEIPFIDELK